MAEQGQSLGDAVQVYIDNKQKLKNKPGGEEIDIAHGNYVSRVYVEKQLDCPDFCEVALNMSEGETNNMFVDTIKEGSNIKIKIGEQGGGAEVKKIFDGFITTIELHLEMDKPDTLVVRAFDYSHKLTRGTLTKSYLEQGYKDVFSDLVSTSGPKFDGSHALSVGDTGDDSGSFPYIPYYNTNPHAFIRSLGRDIDLNVDGYTGTDDQGSEKISFFKIDPSKAPVCKVDPENKSPEQGNFRRMRFVMNTAQQVGEVVVRGWDPKKKEPIVGKATKDDMLKIGDGGLTQTDITGIALYGDKSKFVTLTVVDRPVATQEEADAMAKSIFNKLSMRFVTGECRLKGDPKVNVGEMIEFENMGDRFSGKYLITGVKHILSTKAQENFTTIFKFSGNAIKAEAAT